MGHTNKQLDKTEKFRYIQGAEEVPIPNDLPTIRRGQKLSKDDKLRIAEYICKIYELDRHPIDKIVEQFYMTPRTWHYWVSENSDIAAIYKDACDVRDKTYFKRLQERSRTKLEERIEGKLITLSTRKYKTIVDNEGNESELQLEVENTDRQVYIQPSDTAIIFALTNKDPHNFERNPEPIQKEREAGQYDHWTEEEINAEIKRLENDGY